MFHGALGSTFRRVVCPVRNANCSDCILRQQCLYVAIFEPTPPADHRQAGKYERVPPPYVLTPPLTNRQAFHPGDQLGFELVLMGPALSALPYFIYAATEMGRRGLGRERGKYDLVSVELLDNGESKQVYDEKTGRLKEFTPTVRKFISEDESDLDQLHLSLITFLRLKEKGRLVTDLTFPLFFDSLKRRLGLLASLYGEDGGLPEISFQLGHTENVILTSSELHWYEWERYSARQKAAMKFGGIRGEASLRGPVGRFMPAIRLGEKLHVGQGTSFGLGRYEISYA